MKTPIFFFILITLNFSSLVNAEEINGTVNEIQSLLGEKWDFPSYLHANEESPENSLNILDKAPEGSLISTGSIRSFNSFSKVENFESLIVIDRDPNIILFALIQKSLLKVCNSDLEFQFMILSANFNEWNEKVAKYLESKKITEDPTLTILTLPEVWIWWKKKVRNNRKMDSFHRKVLFTIGSKPFTNMNYLYSNEQFQRLHKAALNNNIFVYRLNLSIEQDINDFFDWIYMKSMKISLCDLSNAWLSYFIPKDRLSQFINKLFFQTEVTQTLFNSILMITAESFSWTKTLTQFFYVGFTSQFIHQNFSNSSDFTQKLTESSQLLNKKNYLHNQEGVNCKLLFKIF